MRHGGSSVAVRYWLRKLWFIPCTLACLALGAPIAFLAAQDEVHRGKVAPHSFGYYSALLGSLALFSCMVGFAGLLIFEVTRDVREGRKARREVDQTLAEVGLLTESEADRRLRRRATLRDEVENYFVVSGLDPLRAALEAEELADAAAARVERLRGEAHRKKTPTRG